ncbi:MAG: helix-turn-helix domain-containing protein [Candidatus Aminicenantes bacterium]|nr:helix-turn-helix domain-containing protein [Candidatus Aminicenantes bacterium]
MARNDRKTVQEIGNRLKDLREHLKFSRKEFALRLGIAMNGYSKNEMGMNIPGIPTLKRLATDFNISMDWLFFNRGNMCFRERPPEVSNVEEKKIPSLAETEPDARELFEFMQEDPLLRHEVLAYFYRYKKGNREPIELPEK